MENFASSLEKSILKNLLKYFIDNCVFDLRLNNFCLKLTLSNDFISKSSISI